MPSLLKKMNTFVILFVACLILTCIIPYNNFHLLNNYQNYLHTKTPYHIVENRNISPIRYQGCEAKKIWMLMRHGSRLPSRLLVDDIRDKLSLIRDEALYNHRCNAELRMLLQHWQLPAPLTEQTEKMLTHVGENEMLELAERMQARFPHLLSHIYSNTSHKFRFTLSSRTCASARYFAMGLFGRATSQLVWFPEPEPNDPLLRFYRLCTKWTKQIKKNPEAQKERTWFLNGPIMQRTVRQVSVKLGFNRTLHSRVELSRQIHMLRTVILPGNPERDMYSCILGQIIRATAKLECELSSQYAFGHIPIWITDDVRLMYLSCTTESSFMNDKPSPWCSVFTQDTIQIMEYAEDLRYYWLDGYGYDLNHKQACPLTQNMMNFLQRKEEHPKAIFYFTHSGTVLKFLAHLGFFNDTRTLLHNNYEQQSGRLWKTSQIGPYSSNLAAVLYQCHDDDDNTETMTMANYKLSFLHQERILPVPWCDNAHLCTLTHVLNYLKHNIESCNFNEMCHL